MALTRAERKLSVTMQKVTLKGEKQRQNFVELGVIQGCVYCKKLEGYWKVYPAGQPSEFLFTFS